MATDPSDANIKLLIGQHWDRRAAEFDAAPNHGLHSDAQRDAWCDLLAQVAGPGTLQVLDVGCGTGFLSLLFAQLGHRVTGIDLAPEMLERARKKAELAGVPVTFSRGDAELIDATDGTYDLVVARHVVWTLPNPEQAANEWRRVLKSGGRVALFEGNWGHGQESRPEYHAIQDRLPFYGGQTGSALRAFLTTMGFNDVAVRPLMESVLWGAEAQNERYVITARRTDQRTPV